MTTRFKPSHEEECADDVAKMIFALGQKYHNRPAVLVSTLTSSLAGYVSLVASEPQTALDACAQALKVFDHARTRTEYFGFKLGVIPGGEENERRERDSIDRRSASD